MALIQAYKNRGLTRDLTILDADGDTITPGANDRVRVLIGREGQTPLLTVVDNADTSNGSTLSKGATNTLRLDATDLDAIDPGTYTLFFDYFDNADAQEWKNVDRQVFHLEDT
jgi:hypothetical protein